MKKFTLRQGCVALAAMALAPTASVWGQTSGGEASPAQIDTKYDTWVCDDELGRTVANSDNGAPTTIRDNAQIGMFYYIWHGQHGAEVKDITRLIEANPANPAFGGEGQFHWGGKPALGYYAGGDAYIIAKHMQWLTDAGMDFIFFDVTNAFIYEGNVKAVMREFDRREALGLKCPKMAFSTHSSSARVVSQLYDIFYSKPEYDKYWYEWEGKPLILTDRAEYETLPDSVKNRFTARYSWAWQTGENQWPWLANYPQGWGYVMRDGKRVNEQISVSTAQHAHSKIGKSYHNGKEPAFNEKALCEETPQGLYFAEQWKRVFDVEPKMVMITQWNEWMAQRFLIKQSYETGYVRPGGQPKIGESYFVDVYNQEFSRDIEPSSEALIRDNYYLQLIDNVRKYRGVRPIPVPNVSKAIDINGDFSQWADVEPEFIDEPGDTEYKGSGDASDRKSNDIVATKVTKDTANIYFYVRTNGNMSLPSVSRYTWMGLYLNTDCNYRNGWNGYDFRVSNSVARMRLQKYDDEKGVWRIVDSKLNYTVRDNEMMIAIPRAELELTDDRDFDFKWADNFNSRAELDILDFYRLGEVAPEGRFNYRYKGSQIVTSVDSPVATDKASVSASGNGSEVSFNISAARGGKAAVSVYNTAGALVMNFTTDVTGDRQTVRRRLPAGVYVVRYTVGGKSGSVKLANVK